MVSVVYSKVDNLVVAAFYEEDDLHLWNLADEYKKKKLNGKGLSLKMRFSPEGRKITSGKGNGTIQIWETNSGESVLEVSIYAGPVADLAYINDGRLLITCGGDSEICLLDSETGQVLDRFNDIMSTTFSWMDRRPSYPVIPAQHIVWRLWPRYSTTILVLSAPC